MIKAVLFDWGGVIAPNQNGGWLDVLSEMLDMPVGELLPHWKAARYDYLSRGKIDEEEFFRLFELSLGKPLPEDVSRIWVDGSAFEPWPEMLSYIQQLKDRGLKVGLISNTVKPMSSVAMQKGLYKGFEPLLISDVEGIVKPEMPIYQNALDQLNISAEECIYVDDLPKNLAPAEVLGMKTVLATEGSRQIISDIEAALMR